MTRTAAKGKAAIDVLEIVFRALADKTRLRILGLLGNNEVCVCHIHDSLGLPQPTVSRHLAYLRRAGLVDVRRDGRRTLYRTNADALRPLHEWTGTFSRYWGRQLSRIKAHAEAKKKEEP